MRLTPLERRKRIQDLLGQDPKCSRMMAGYMQARDAFTRYTDGLPEKERDFLWRFPGEGYFLHQNILNLLCEYMRFEDETNE